MITELFDIKNKTIGTVFLLGGHLLRVGRLLFQAPLCPQGKPSARLLRRRAPFTQILLDVPESSPLDVASTRQCHKKMYCVGSLNSRGFQLWAAYLAD